MILALIRMLLDSVFSGFMTGSDDTSGRLTIRLAGLLQEVRDAWVNRLNQYFSQLESLVDGQWLSSEDLTGVIRESKMASREALDGLGEDLGAELLHLSNVLSTRFQAERRTLEEEIADLRRTVTLALSGDENEVRRENDALRTAIMTMPEFTVLAVLQKHKRASYDVLSEELMLKKSKVRKYAKGLVEKGYASIDKKSRPHSVVYLSAPWKRLGQDLRTGEVSSSFSTQSQLSSH